MLKSTSTSNSSSNTTTSQNSNTATTSNVSMSENEQIVFDLINNARTKKGLKKLGSYLTDNKIKGYMDFDIISYSKSISSSLVRYTSNKL